MVSGSDGNGKIAAARFNLRYPKHRFEPEDLLDFIELPVFTKRWSDLGLDDDDDLAALQITIMMDPTAAPPLVGTRGIRKLRFSPCRWKSGKRGAARVLYVYFAEFGIVLLALAYGKNELDDISESAKKQLNQFVDEIEHELRRRKTL